jgi:cyclopropane fatty-acyl-phospholipid synthase-like methyltransferase
MIYTSGVISNSEIKESLETLQDNKLAVVCSKLDLKPEDRLLDIGCGWGTLVAYAAKNYGCDATGVTLSRNQAKFGTDRIEKNDVRATRSFSNFTNKLTFFYRSPVPEHVSFVRIIVTYLLAPLTQKLLAWKWPRYVA